MHTNCGYISTLVTQKIPFLQILRQLPELSRSQVEYLGSQVSEIATPFDVFRERYIRCHSGQPYKHLSQTQLGRCVTCCFSRVHNVTAYLLLIKLSSTISALVNLCPNLEGTCERLMMEKDMKLEERLPLTYAHASQEPRRARSLSKRFVSCIFLIFLISAIAQVYVIFPEEHSPGPKSGKKHGKLLCAQVPALYPANQSDEVDKLDSFFLSDEFRNLSSTRLTGAVQIPTESFDDLGPIGQDERWEIMYKFADYLKQTYPVVHERLGLEKVNTHGLLYTWQGTDETLRPTLLMAHQDVVPVPKSTVNSWTHPPFSGFNDGKYIWGRGASDCKNQLTGILEAVESLLKAGYSPKRTVVMPFGFDEEISGGRGAAYLSSFLLERYGQDGIATVVDEGAGFSKAWGVQAALPGVGEKGYTDVHITVRMPGGHSSIPPPHTGIGVMAELITLIEADKYSPHLDDQNPYLGLLTCGAEYAPKFPPKLKKLLNRRLKKSHVCKHKDKLAQEAAKLSPAIRYLMQTSVAADLIDGGVKTNALPERTTAVINHRINIGEFSSDVASKLTHIAQKIAHKYNLTLHAFGNQTETPSSITLFKDDRTLEAAPITPTDATVVSPWSVLSGTIRALYGEEVIVAPGLMTGNTDTRYYWGLTKHIFRFTPGWDGEEGLGNIHTVDERVSINSHINMVRWMSLFIRNMDEAQME